MSDTKINEEKDENQHTDSDIKLKQCNENVLHIKIHRKDDHTVLCQLPNVFSSKIILNLIFEMLNQTNVNVRCF